MALKKLLLNEEEKAFLETGSRSRSDLRLRDRSRTIRWFHEGVAAQEIVHRLGITREAVYERRYRWNEKGLPSLQDAPRRGVPSKLSEDMLAELKRWSTEEALNARELLSRIQEKYGIQVHLSTIKRACERMGLVWKRTRHSLKKKRPSTL